MREIERKKGSKGSREGEKEGEKERVKRKNEREREGEKRGRDVKRYVGGLGIFVFSEGSKIIFVFYVWFCYVVW